MNKIILNNLKLKTFTEQDALDYCLLNNINPLNITELYLSYNELTNISGIKLFKNLKILSLEKNQLTDISVIQYLKNLELLDIEILELKSDQIEYIKSLKKLKYLYCGNGFKDMNITNQLNKNIKLW